MSVSCETCGAPTPYEGTRRCDLCWNVERLLPDYLRSPGGRAFVRAHMPVGGTTVYMVRDNSTGRFYKRSNGGAGHDWVERERGSIWTTRSGAGAALGHCRRYALRTRKPETFEIVGFTLIENGHDDIQPDNTGALAGRQASRSQEGN